LFSFSLYSPSYFKIDSGEERNYKTKDSSSLQEFANILNFCNANSHNYFNQDEIIDVLKGILQ